MSKTQFKELLEEYISNLEKDYDSNQTGFSYGNYSVHIELSSTGFYFYTQYGKFSQIFSLVISGEKK